LAFPGIAQGILPPFAQGNRHLCLTSRHIHSYLEAKLFCQKKKLPPFSTLGFNTKGQLFIANEGILIAIFG
jgi:hypothetical protein